MKISILGVGDLTKIPRHAKTTKKELEKLIDSLARTLAKKEHEIVIVPDRGVPVELARSYKKYGGKSVIGFVPRKDKRYGIKHLEPNLNIVDKEINPDTWYETSSEIAAYGDLCIVIGMSPGILREITPLKYKYKFKQASTKVFWFRDTISITLPKEIEEEIPITYIKSVKELKKYL